MTRTQAIILGWTIGVFSVIGIADNREAEIQRAHYCEMVQLHKDSNGALGWPAYDGECE
jgi:hypothetical protein